MAWGSFATLARFDLSYKAHKEFRDSNILFCTNFIIFQFVFFDNLIDVFWGNYFFAHILLISNKNNGNSWTQVFLEKIHPFFDRIKGWAVCQRKNQINSWDFFIIFLESFSVFSLSVWIKYLKLKCWITVLDCFLDVLDTLIICMRNSSKEELITFCFCVRFRVWISTESLNKRGFSSLSVTNKEKINHWFIMILEKRDFIEMFSWPTTIGRFNK